MTDDQLANDVSHSRYTRDVGYTTTNDDGNDAGDEEDEDDDGNNSDDGDDDESDNSDNNGDAGPTTVRQAVPAMQVPVMTGVNNMDVTNEFRPQVNQMMQQNDLQRTAMQNQIGVSLPETFQGSLQSQGRSPSPMKSMFQPHQMMQSPVPPPVAPFFGPQQTMGVGQPVAGPSPMMQNNMRGMGGPARSMQSSFNGNNEYSNPSYQEMGGMQQFQNGGGSSPFQRGVGNSQFNGGGQSPQFQNGQQFQGGGGGGSQFHGNQEEGENGATDEEGDDDDADDDENKDREQDKEELDPAMQSAVAKWQDSIDPLVSKIYQESAAESNIKNTLSSAASKYLPKATGKQRHKDYDLELGGSALVKRVGHPRRPSNRHFRKPVTENSDVALDFNEPSTLSFIDNKHDDKNIADLLSETPKKEAIHSTGTRKSSEGEAAGGFAANLYNNLMNEDANIIANANGEEISAPTKKQVLGSKKHKTSEEDNGAKKSSDKSKMNLHDVLNYITPSDTGKSDTKETTKSTGESSSPPLSTIDEWAHTRDEQPKDSKEKAETKSENEGSTKDSRPVNKVKVTDHDDAEKKTDEIKASDTSKSAATPDTDKEKAAATPKGASEKAPASAETVKENSAAAPPEKAAATAAPEVVKEKAVEAKDKSDATPSADKEKPSPSPDAAKQKSTTASEPVKDKSTAASEPVKDKSSAVAEPPKEAPTIAQKPESGNFSTNATDTKRQSKGFTLVGNKGDESVVVAITITKPSNHTNSTSTGLSSFDNKAIGNVISSMIDAAAREEHPKLPALSGDTRHTTSPDSPTESSHQNTTTEKQDQVSSNSSKEKTKSLAKDDSDEDTASKCLQSKDCRKKVLNKFIDSTSTDNDTKDKQHLAKQEESSSEKHHTKKVKEIHDSKEESPESSELNKSEESKPAKVSETSKEESKESGESKKYTNAHKSKASQESAEDSHSENEVSEAKTHHESHESSESHDSNDESRDVSESKKSRGSSDTKESHEAQETGESHKSSDSADSEKGRHEEKESSSSHKPREEKIDSSEKQESSEKKAKMGALEESEVDAMMKAEAEQTQKSERSEKSDKSGKSDITAKKKKESGTKRTQQNMMVDKLIKKNLQRIEEILMKYHGFKKKYDDMVDPTTPGSKRITKSTFPMQSYIRRLSQKWRNFLQKHGNVKLHD